MGRMKTVSFYLKATASFFLLCLLLSCAARQRAMYMYYRNHPEMLSALLKVKSVYLEDVQGAENREDALNMKRALIEALNRRGEGRFMLAQKPSDADAVLKTDMQKELGPVDQEEPLLFELEPEMEIKREVFARMELMDPKTGRLIYKTDSEERSEFEIDSIGKAAYKVIDNLMDEIESAEHSA
jgi:hypothetical protein